jgi:ubiquinone/menaquinone biosynthesis C-methylase UbiE
MNKRGERVCPVERAGGLDARIRRWLQNPQKMLCPYLREGMTALDVGCGPGFFSLDMATMVGPSGRVIAADLQEGMLQIVRDKIMGTELEDRITLHTCEQDSLGVTEPVDFALLFYVVHEIPEKKGLFTELARLLKPGGQILVVEPPFHVSKSAFTEMIRTAQAAGLVSTEAAGIRFSKTVLLKKA